MNSSIIGLIRAGAAVVNDQLQGRKRWLSLLAYLMLAAATVLGFPLDDLARELALDPGITKDSTLIAIATAAGITFRFFQNMGHARRVDEQVASLEARLDKRGIK